MNTEQIFVVDDYKFFAKYFIMKFKTMVREHVQFHHFSELMPVFAANSTMTPSLIFLDNELGDEKGVEAIPELSETYPNTEIILISSLDSDELNQQAVLNGASRFISKDDIVLDKIVERLRSNVLETAKTQRAKSLLR
ncbi:MAG: response regulator [Crocinitomicaceae bacterium]|nr:response regulator [Crocinitomicaceae bacterium]